MERAVTTDAVTTDGDRPDDGGARLATTSWPGDGSTGGRPGGGDRGLGGRPRSASGLCLTASMTDAVLIDVATRVEPGIEIVFLDTGYHFPETLATVDVVRRRYHPSLTVLSADVPLDDRWRTDTDGCCAARKVAPLDELLAGRDRLAVGPAPGRRPRPGRHAGRWNATGGAWSRSTPWPTWSDDGRGRLHPPPRRAGEPPRAPRATRRSAAGPAPGPSAAGEDARAGRWSGTAKTECGLHL